MYSVLNPSLSKILNLVAALQTKYFMCQMHPNGWFSKIRSQFLIHYCTYFCSTVHPQNSKNESSNDSYSVGIAILVVLLVIAIICNVVQAVIYYKLKKKKIKSETVAMWVI